jgi:hypothetical protein
MVTRRLFLARAGAALAAPGLLRAGGYDAVPASLDHIILGISDLERGIAWMERKSGVRAVMGGVHPGRGTRNALLSLGHRRYLEIMAPDPAQPASSETRGLGHLSSPRIIGWASHLDSAQAIADHLTKSGIAFSGPTAGSRKRPDGRVLDWQTVELTDDAAGTLPFFIEWGAHSPHPSEDSPLGLSLLSFEAGAPDPTSPLAVSNALGLGLHVGKRPHPILRARFRGPRGEFAI